MKKLLKIVMGIVVVFVLAIAAIFYFTAGLADSADVFFQAVKQKDIAKARSYLSEDFKASTDENALKEFLSKGALLNFKEASWSNRQISGDRGELSGSITTETGGVVPLKLMFVKENKAWKIFAIQKPTAGLQTQDASPSVPTKAEQVALVRGSMHDFAVSVNNKSMAYFYKTVSQTWQRQFTIQKLDESYGQLYGKGLDLTVLDTLVPVIEGEPKLGENGELILSGRYTTTPKAVHFEQKYIYEGVSWKLFGLFIDIK
jgi:hypothetical protein